MELYEYILSVGGFVLASLALIVSIFANRQSKKSNDIAKDSVDKAESANILSAEANKIAARSYELSEKNCISRFRVELQEISISNDAYLCDSINEAMRNGTAQCRFAIQDLSGVEAHFITIENHNTIQGLRTEGMELSEKKYVEITHDFQLSRVNTASKEQNNSVKQVFKHTVYLKWDNGLYSCSCEIVFEFVIEEYYEKGRKQYRLCRSDNNKCKTKNYTMTSVFD